MTVKDKISTDDCTIELWNNFLKYSDNSIVARIDGEPLVGPSADYLVYRRCIHHWEVAGVKGEVSDAEKLRIIANVERAFAANGMVLRLE
ncbi:MAG TPA: Imm74 family immunity protein [Polyangiaceae bacterium]